MTVLKCHKCPQYLTKELIRNEFQNQPSELPLPFGTPHLRALMNVLFRLSQRSLWRSLNTVTHMKDSLVLKNQRGVREGLFLKTSTEKGWTILISWLQVSLHGISSHTEVECNVLWFFRCDIFDRKMLRRLCLVWGMCHG